MTCTSLIWFRKDLRIDDNEALFNACKSDIVIPLFIFDKTLIEYSDIGEASHWWLEKSLEELNKQLDNKLNILSGNSYEILLSLAKKYNLNRVYWNRCYEADRIELDTKIKKNLNSKDIVTKSYNSSLLWEPWTISNKTGGFYKVFTPYFKNGCMLASSPRKPQSLKIKKNFKKIDVEDYSYSFKYFKTNKSISWSKKFSDFWKPGEKSAKLALKTFLNTEASGNYSEGRNLPAKNYVSRLSPHLHWGEISPFTVWYEAKKNMTGENKTTYLSELGWREFSYYLMYHFPNINKDNLKKNFDQFPWINDERLLSKWKKGVTGYPIVDAGMRELWDTGYMHNRSRMITSSFLVKNLLTHWKYGERWFHDCLLDADLASNSASWQWVAGTGTDAAPFFRIFNPITQSQKFDTDAEYIKKYVPELKHLPKKMIFSPWRFSKNELAAYNLELGKDYPFPIIDYEYSRKRALNVFKSFSNRNV